MFTLSQCWCSHCHNVDFHTVTLFTGAKKGRRPMLTHSQMWSGEQMLMFTLSQCWCSHCHTVYRCKEGSRANADPLTDVVRRTDVNVYIVTMLMFTLSQCWCSHCHTVYRCKEGSQANADPLTDVVGQTDVDVHTVTVLLFTLSQCWCSHCHTVYRCKEGSRAHADALTDVVGRTDVNVYIVTVLMFTLSHCFQLQRRVVGPRWRTHRRGRANRCRGCCSRGRRPHPRRPPPPRRPQCAPSSSWWTWQAASALVSAAFHSSRIRIAAAVLVNFTSLSLINYFLKRKILSVEVILSA